MNWAASEAVTLLAYLLPGFVAAAEVSMVEFLPYNKDEDDG